MQMRNLLEGRMARMTVQSTPSTPPQSANVRPKLKVGRIKMIKPRTIKYIIMK